jgi:hypothetical protein
MENNKMRLCQKGEELNDKVVINTTLRILSSGFICLWLPATATGYRDASISV